MGIRGKIVSIGRPYSTAEAAIQGEDGRFLDDGETGELLLGGTQLGDGYLDRDELTRERFPTNADRRWYRTGDVALRDSDGRYHHLGRIDNQLKERGYRVELEDVEAQLRAVSDAISVAAMGWPHGASTADYLRTILRLARSLPHQRRIKVGLKRNGRGKLQPFAILNQTQAPLATPSESRSPSSGISRVGEPGREHEAEP